MEYFFLKLLILFAIGSWFGSFESLLFWFLAIEFYLS